MINDKEFLTGIIESEEGPLTFVVDDFRFRFMDTSLDYNVRTLKPKDGFLFGKTHENNKIAIRLTFDIPVQNVANLKTDNYIISDGNYHTCSFEEIDSISFIGGTLNTLFWNEALQEDFSENKEPDTIKYYIKDDSIKFSYVVDDIKFDVTICSNITNGWGIEGSYLKNTDVSLKLSFSKKIALKNVFYHIEKVKEIISILTYRRNIGFDIIKVSNSAKANSSATIYLKNNNELTKKHYSKNIMFADIKDALPSFFETIYKSNDSKPLYDFGFIPFSDKEARYITVPMIRSITPAVECEYSFMSFPKFQNDRLESLIKDVKAVIKAHRKSDQALEDKTYNNIYNSINNWSLSFSDKIWQMINDFDDATSTLLGFDISTYRDDINRFVKFRNDITHGRIREVDHHIAVTGYVLAGLVYCCFLRRVGVDNETINKLCENCLLK